MSLPQRHVVKTIKKISVITMNGRNTNTEDLNERREMVAQADPSTKPKNSLIMIPLP